MAEIFEEAGDTGEAIAFYTQAADLYAGEEVTSTANNCKLKVAALSASAEDYATAIQLFTEVARASLENNLLKYSVKGYLLCAGLCTLCCADAVGIANATDKAVELDATFEDTREHKLLVDLAGAMETGDVDAFTATVQEFDSMSRLDAWKTALLLRAKKRCAANEVGDGEDDLTCAHAAGLRPPALTPRAGDRAWAWGEGGAGCNRQKRAGLVGEPPLGQVVGQFVPPDKAAPLENSSAVLHGAQRV